MKTTILFITLLIFAFNTNAQKTDSTKYEYCELISTPKALGAGLTYEVSLWATDLERFKADTTYSRLTVEKRRPAFYTMSIPLTIMGSHGWKLILTYYTEFQKIPIQHYILERKITQ